MCTEHYDNLSLSPVLPCILCREIRTFHFSVRIPVLYLYSSILVTIFICYKIKIISFNSASKSINNLSPKIMMNDLVQYHLSLVAIRGLSILTKEDNDLSH